MTGATTHTIDVPGDVLAHDIRPCSDADSIPLVMVASPMAAAGFTTLAGHVATAASWAQFGLPRQGSGDGHNEARLGDSPILIRPEQGTEPPTAHGCGLSVHGADDRPAVPFWVHVRRPWDLP